MAREMKDSGIEWIGEIPKEWSITKIGVLFFAKAGGDAKPELYSDIYDDTHPFPVYTNTMDKNQVYAYTSKPIFKANTITVTGRGDVGHAFYRNTPYDAIIRLISLMPRCNLDCRYYAYWINDVIHFFTDNAAIGQLSAQQITQYPISVLPLPEQQKIAAHLDSECAKIDDVITKTKATIEEYKKLKQSVITEAVTKGIRPNREMKDSGIEWIGEIPRDWKISRVGRHYNIILGKMLCNNQISDDYSLENYFCAANIHFDGISVSDGLKKMWFSSDEKSIYKVNCGDMLVVEGGAGAGGCCVVSELAGEIYIQNSIMIVRNKQTDNNRYLRYLIESFVKRGYIDIVCNKATIPHFTKDKLANVPYPILPNDEMNEISNYLDKKCSEIDTLIEKKEQIVTELESYKKSLIYEYVTGKKEVI